MTVELELRNIDKRYGERQLLHHFNIAVEKGEFLACIGSSGSGKTTVLKLMNGLLAPDGGQVLFRGEDISTLDQNRLRRQMGYVIQGTGLFPHLPVRENIAFVPRLDKADDSSIRERVDELAAAVRLEPDVLPRYPRELSGGQRQRVGIARALAANPALLLMDEPFGAVDDITRKTLREEMRRIHAELGLTVFFITHDIGEALSLGTRVVVLHEGKIEQDGPPDSILHQPATPFVEDLVDSELHRCPV